MSVICSYAPSSFRRNERAESSRAALRAAAGAAAAYLAVLALLNVIDVFTITLPYGKPRGWLTIPFWNNFFLMAVMIWTQTGLAMVFLSAALRGIPQETVEAAIIDGATPFQLLFRIKIPQIVGTIVVVWTIVTVIVLRVFDIVFTITMSNWKTADPGKLLVPQAVQRPRLGRRVGVCDHPPAASDAAYDLECVQIPLREKGGLTMDGIVETKSSLKKWVVRITVVLLVADVGDSVAGSVRLFVPNQGLSYSTVSGWWTAFFTTEQNKVFRAADPDDFRRADGDVFTVSGNLFGEAASKKIILWGTKSASE